MVIFCHKIPTSPLRFRETVEADFLGSDARRWYLVPEHEINEDVFRESEGVEEDGVLTLATGDRLRKWQEKSALGHWEIMRTVLPAVVWDAW